MALTKKMKHIAYFTCAAALFSATAFADIDDGIAPTMELSSIYGVVQRHDERIGLDDDGKAYGFEFRYRFPESNFDCNFRLRNSSFNHDHEDPANTFYNLPTKAPHYQAKDETIFKRGTVAQAEETKVIDGRAQLIYNFAKDEDLNPYLMFGLIYQKTTDKYNLLKDMNTRWYYEPIHYKYDDDGVSFIGGVGLDFRRGFFYSRLEASYFGELYDEDDEGQFELAGTLGFYLCDGLRFDVFVSYFTEYDDLLTAAGLCLAL